MTATSRFDTITTDRLLMRRWRDSDREPFAELNGDPDTLRFFPSTLTRAESDAFVDLIESRFELQGYGLWALEITATGEFIGFTGLNAMPEGVRGRRPGGRLAARQDRLAPRLRDRGGQGRAGRGVRAALACPRSGR